MQEVIYYDESHCQLVYDKEDNIIISYWKGYQTSDKIKIVFNLYYKVMEETNSSIVLADLSQLKGSFTAINDWVEKEWMPKAISKGHKIHAMVYSPDVFGKFTMDDINDRYEKTKNPLIKVKFFDDIESAKNWIKEQEEYS